MSANRIPEFRYRSSLIFGDSNWRHIAELNQLGLSKSNPLSFCIGDIVIPSIFESPTKLKSNWLWRYNFNSANSSNYWSSYYGSNGSSTPTTWGVGVGTSSYYSVGEGNTVSEGYVTSGNPTGKLTLQTIRFSSYDDWYFTPSVYVPSSVFMRAIACRFLALYEADLPSDMYTISNRTVTWNVNHPIYLLLNGKECYPY